MSSLSTRPGAPYLSSRRASIIDDTLRRRDVGISEPMPLSTPWGFQSIKCPEHCPGPTWTRPVTSLGHGTRNDNSGTQQWGRPIHSSLVELNRVSYGPSVVQSSTSTIPSKTSLGHRSTSGIKAAVRRLFGSKRHRSSLSHLGYEYQLSEPNSLSRVEGESSTKPPVGQSPSQRPEAVSKHSALGSHTPLSPSETVKQSRWEPPSDWKSLKSRQRRRNTLPSVVLSQQEAQLIARALDHNISKLGGSSSVLDEDQYKEIPTVLKRRSRSADELNELAKSLEDTNWGNRAREDEIAYWKAAAKHDQHVDSSPARPCDPDTSQGVKRLTRNALRVEPSFLPPMASSTYAFEFGLPGAANDSVSLEQRVSTLEVKVVDFEYAIAKLQGQDVGRAAQPAKTPKRRSVHELFPIPNAPSINPPGSHYSQTFLSSPRDSPLEPVEFLGSELGDRASRATTIRPPNNQRRSSNTRAGSPSRAHQDMNSFDTIMVLLKQEQAARERLEGQVMDLQRELEELRTPIYAYIRPATMPTPSPELPHTSPTAPKARTLHRAPPFARERGVNLQEMSRFSMADTDDGNRSGTEDGFDDVYETPQEKRYTFETPRTSTSPRSSPAFGTI